MLAFPAGLLGLVASAATATTPTTPPALVERVLNQQLELARMQSIDDRCHWLDATTRLALDATAAERQAWLQDKAPGQASSEADVAANTTKANAVACTASQEATSIRFGTWQMRITWALRGQALLDGDERPAWYAQQSPVLKQRKALNETLAALEEKYGPSIDQARPRVAAEAMQMLALVCPNKPHQCPTENAAEHGKGYAQVWLQQTTRFAEALAKDPVKLPPLPN